jgi:hypothetical protein
MAAADAVYRETQARLHRVLGNYLAIVAWKAGIDCIILERKTLLSFLDLSKMKNVRIDWLKEDLKPLFPECHTTNTSSSGVYATLYLSRRKIPADKGVWKAMTTAKRIEILGTNGIAAAAVEIPKEKELIKKMALALAGLEHL